MPAPNALPVVQQAIYCSALLPVVSLDTFLSEDDGDSTLVCERPSPEAVLIERDEARQLRIAITGLPPRQKVVLELVVHDGLSQAEAARRMNVSEAAVSKLVTKARQTLASTLAA